MLFQREDVPRIQNHNSRIRAGEAAQDRNLSEPAKPSYQNDPIMGTSPPSTTEIFTRLNGRWRGSKAALTVSVVAILIGTVPSDCRMSSCANAHARTRDLSRLRTAA